MSLFLTTLSLLAASPVDEARALATELAHADFEAAERRFAPEVSRAVPQPVLESQWKALTGGLGAFREVKAPVPESERVVKVEAVYERGSLFLRVGFDASGKVNLLRPASGKSDADFERASKAVLTDLATGRFEGLAKRFADADASHVIAAGVLERGWKDLQERSGAFVSILSTSTSMNGGLHVVDVTCRFKREDAVVRTVFDDRLGLQGLFYKAAWSPPAALDRSAFTERPVTVVGSKALPLPGTLTLPNGKGPFPAVVLVHGSGPNDADESLGANKLFKDLAWGLAARGVAVLRYEKRTFTWRQKLSASDVPTVREETIDDARAAVALLAAEPRVDAKRVFVVGHSLGATLAPRIAADDPAVHGVVMLAAAARPLGQLMVEQLEYLAAHAPDSHVTPAAIAQAKQRAARMEDPELQPTDVIDGIPGTYWLDLRAHDPVAAAVALDRPVLVLQGERDVQVTMTDFKLWQRALGAKKNVTLRSIAGLNHHFLPGSAPSVPAEYERPSHVPEELLDGLAKWLVAH